jgi:glycosyltransferase involved in cell wall biosynthesis
MSGQASKALMLCYYFPPLITSGVTRSAAFARLLPEFGWQPIVLTVSKSADPWVKTGAPVPEGARIERTAEWNFPALLDFFHGAMSRLCGMFGHDLQTNYMRELFAIPDTQIAWQTTWRGIQLAKESDVIYASCSPFSSAVSAALIKAVTKKPLVIDFRDAWTLNPHIAHIAPHSFIIGLLERFAVNSCDAFIVNTEGAAKLYRERYPRWSNKIEVIPNGYDKLTPVTAQADKDTFRIMHVGSFYGSRSPDLLLEAMAELPELPLEFIQIGEGWPTFDRFREKFKITVHGTVPHTKALELMGEASLLYLKQGFEAGVTDYIAVAAKTFEYLATGLPTLIDAPPGDNAELIRKYGENSYVVTNNSKDDLKRAIKSAYDRRKAVIPTVNPEFAERFNRRNLTARLAAVFDRSASA